MPMFKFGWDSEPRDCTTENITKFNMLMIGELGKIHRRLEVLEADLAARRAKEAEAEKAEREKLYHGVG